METKILFLLCLIPVIPALPLEDAPDFETEQMDVSNPAEAGTCANIDPKTRVDCGYFGITKAKCMHKGCCWNDTVHNVPYCFNKPDTSAPDYEACSSRDPKLRVDCGYYGIDKATCQGKGCCYDNSVGGGVPWCFNKPDTSQAECVKVDHIRRVECGYLGITEEQCHHRRCCYDDSTLGAKYCFNKSDTSSPDYKTCSKVDPLQRVDCGRIGISKDQCLDKGCCYDNSLNGLPWCFNKPATSVPDICSNVDPKERRDCGHLGITRGQCLGRRCCYDNTLKDYPWCYYPEQHQADEADESLE